MRSIIALVALFAAAATATEEVIKIRADPTQGGPTPKQTPAESPRIGASTSHGCYSSSGELQDYGGYDPRNVSRGSCGEYYCPMQKATVFATKGEKCYCGFSYPPQDTLVDDSNCNFKCPAYPFEACGGIGVGSSFFSVYNSGLALDIPYAAASSSSSTPSGSGGSSPTATPEAKKGPNVGGIAAGVVVAVIAVGAIIGGGFFYMRRKRNREIEEEHRRNAAVSSFVGGKPPSSSGGLSMSDSRLDPALAHHRLSTGSIADNQDYSRKILRVTNA